VVLELPLLYETGKMLQFIDTVIVVYWSVYFTFFVLLLFNFHISLHDILTLTLCRSNASVLQSTNSKRFFAVFVHFHSSAYLPVG